MYRTHFEHFPKFASNDNAELKIFSPSVHADTHGVIGLSAKLV